MKKTMKNLLLMGLVTLAAGMFTACSDSDSGGGGGDTPIINPDGPTAGGMVAKTLSGIVRDTNGNGVAGVSVTSGTSIATTNSAGMFTFSNVFVNDKRIIVQFHKDGYFDNTRACDAGLNENWEVVLVKKGGSAISDNQSFGAGAGGSLSAGGMKVEFSGGSFKDVANGTNLPSGTTVVADLAYLNPDDENFADMMPGGDLIAVGETGPDAQLLSYGMIAVNLTDDSGNKVNLKDGSTAKVSFPIPESLKGNTPATIPLWSFNEQTGKWEKDGEAKLVGDHYEGTVSHFSWWNLDYPYQQGSIEGYVKNEKGEPIPFITVHIGQITGMTDENGYYQHKVMADEEFDVWVDGADYNGVEGAIAKVTLTVNVFENRKDVNLTVPTVPTIKGTVKNADGTNTIASLVIEYGSNKTKAMISKSNGTFQIYAPVGYTGPATLVGRTAADREKRVDFTLDGTEKTLNLVFDGPTAKNSLLVTFEDGRSFTIDLSAVTAEIADDNIFISSEYTQGGSYFSANVSNSGNGSVYASCGFGYAGAPENTWLSTDQTIVSTFAYDNENVVCQFAGSGRENDNSNWQAGTKVTKFIFETTQITAPITLIQRRLFDVIPKNIGFPSFTPQLDTPSPMVIYFGKSPNGKGGMINYGGGLAEFNSLKAQADASGIPFIKENTFETEDWRSSNTGGEPKKGTCTERIYYGGNKFIYIAYDTSVEGIDFTTEEGRWYMEEGMVPNFVMVFDNLKNMDDYQQYIHRHHFNK